MSTPEMSLIHPVTMPVVLSVAMNRKASGTPPKLANTPEAVITTCRSRLPRLAVKIAYAMSSPKIPGTIAVAIDSRIEVFRPSRYVPCSAVSTLLHVKPPLDFTNPPLELLNEAIAIAMVGAIRPRAM